MSKRLATNKKSIPDNKKRSEEDFVEEQIRNQQTIDIFIESDKNWS